MKDFLISALPLSNAFEARLNSFNWKDEKLKNKAFECLDTMKEAEKRKIDMNNQTKVYVKI